MNQDSHMFQVALCQDDLTVLLRILMENIGEASSLQSDTPTGSELALKQESVLVRARTATGERKQLHTDVLYNDLAYRVELNGWPCFV